MKVIVKPDAPMGKTDSPRALYKALGKGHLFDLEMRDAKKDARQWREHTRGKRRPDGIGERIFTIPETLMEHLRTSNQAMYQNEPKKFWCYIFHNWSDFCCIEGRCPWCGRK